jgi:hypothetical protein
MGKVYVSSAVAGQSITSSGQLLYNHVVSILSCTSVKPSMLLLNNGSHTFAFPTRNRDAKTFATHRMAEDDSEP